MVWRSPPPIVGRRQCRTVAATLAEASWLLHQGRYRQSRSHRPLFSNRTVRLLTNATRHIWSLRKPLCVTIFTFRNYPHTLTVHFRQIIWNSHKGWRDTCPCPRRQQKYQLQLVTYNLQYCLAQNRLRRLRKVNQLGNNGKCWISMAAKVSHSSCKQIDSSASRTVVEHTLN